MELVAYIGLDIQFVRLRQTDRDRGLVFIDMYDLPHTDLSAFAGLIITNYVDEEFMLLHRSIFDDYLEAGGVICSLAEMSKSYLPNAPIWHRSPTSIREREIQLTEPVYPMFAGIDPYDLNYRQGVKGFFTRGYFKEVPKGAHIIVQDESGAPIMYVDRQSTNGVLIVGSGTDLYQVYRDEKSSANRLASQMIEVICNEAHKRKEQHA